MRIASAARRRSWTEMRGVRVTRLLAWGSVLFAVLGCASYAVLAPQRVDRVPAGEYGVLVSQVHEGDRQPGAVLFAPANAEVTLAGARPGAVATPEVYAAQFKSAFVVYALRDAAGVVRGYLMAPAGAQVRVWDRSATRGGILVTVRSGESELEAGGGSGGM